MKRQTKKNMYIGLGVLAAVILIGGLLYLYNPFNAENAIYTSNAKICEPQAAYYDSFYSSDKALSQYVESITENNVLNNARWTVTDKSSIGEYFGGFNQAGYNVIYYPYMAIKPEGFAKIRQGLDGVLLMPSIKIYYLGIDVNGQKVNAGFADCTQLLENIQYPGLNIIDRKAKIYTLKNSNVYMTCSANKKFLLVFESRNDAVQFKLKNVVCPVSIDPNTGSGITTISVGQTPTQQ